MVEWVLSAEVVMQIPDAGAAGGGAADAVLYCTVQSATPPDVDLGSLQL